MKAYAFRDSADQSRIMDRLNRLSIRVIRRTLDENHTSGVIYTDEPFNLPKKRRR